MSKSDTGLLSHYRMGALRGGKKKTATKAPSLQEIPILIAMSMLFL